MKEKRVSLYLNSGQETVDVLGVPAGGLLHAGEELGEGGDGGGELDIPDLLGAVQTQLVGHALALAQAGVECLLGQGHALVLEDVLKSGSGAAALGLETVDGLEQPDGVGDGGCRGDEGEDEGEHDEQCWHRESDPGTDVSSAPVRVLYTGRRLM